MITLFCLFQIFSFHVRKERDKISDFVFSASDAVSTISKKERNSPLHVPFSHFTDHYSHSYITKCEGQR